MFLPPLFFLVLYAKWLVIQRIIRTCVETTGAGKAVGFEGLSRKDPLGGLCGTGPPAFSAIQAGVLFDSDFEDAQILNQPAEQPERA